MSKDMKGGACSTHGGDEKCIQNLVGKHEGKSPLGRPGYRWEDNIKMDLREIGFGLDSTGPGSGLVAGSCEHGNEPSGSIKAGNFLSS
jgi:hypothetical protein